MTPCAELFENKEVKLLGDVDLRRWPTGYGVRALELGREPVFDRRKFVRSWPPARLDHAESTHDFGLGVLTAKCWIVVRRSISDHPTHLSLIRLSVLGP